ncbi:MAG: glycosyltransferase [Acidobacteriia bacterium]|nr:glycosyltransferase [Terriglobia bacterium]
MLRSVQAVDRKRGGASVSDATPLPESLLEKLAEIGEVDVLVGIPSFNNAATIGHVVRAIQAGFAKYFPGERTLLIDSDGGSADGTPEVVRTAFIGDFQTVLATASPRAVHRVTSPYHGVPGKGSALRTVFAAAQHVGARACAVVDADLRSITPEWIDLLVSPVLHYGYDFVAPLYRRHKYDGTITNSIVYPLTRALYGRRVRQPIGGEFGFSAALAQHFLKQPVWDSEVARFGVDIWMTTTAITGGFRVCQSFLGAKIHDAKDPGVDLAAMLTQVVGAVFLLMETHAAQWRQVKESAPVPEFGFEYTVGLEPLRVNVERMLGIFAAGVRELGSVWERVLAAETFAQVQTLAVVPPEAFRFPTDLWVRSVYDFALAHHRKTINRDHLLKALTPLYLGRTASFVLETTKADATAVEEVIEELCLEYERMKPYLVERWEV